MKTLLLGILGVVSVGCTIEVTVREPLPVKEMMLRAGEDPVHNRMRVEVIDPKEEKAKQDAETKALLQLYYEWLAKEQI